VLRYGIVELRYLSRQPLLSSPTIDIFLFKYHYSKADDKYLNTTYNYDVMALQFRRLTTWDGSITTMAYSVYLAGRGITAVHVLLVKPADDVPETNEFTSMKVLESVYVAGPSQSHVMKDGNTGET